MRGLPIPFKGLPIPHSYPLKGAVMYPLYWVVPKRCPGELCSKSCVVCLGLAQVIEFPGGYVIKY